MAKPPEGLPVTHNNTTRLLRCRRTGRYWDGKDWTEHRGQAAEFEDEMQATRECEARALKEVELVLRSPADGSEVYRGEIET